MTVRVTFSDEEFEALYQMPHMDYVLYLWLRRYMDFKTRVVGLSYGLSRKMLQERLEVPATAGRAHQAVGDKAIRCSLDRLVGSGLLVRRGGPMSMVFLMPMAPGGTVRPKEVGPIWGRFGAEEVGPEVGPVVDAGEAGCWLGSKPINGAEAGPEVGPICGLDIEPVSGKVGPTSADQISDKTLSSSSSCGTSARDGLSDDDHIPDVPTNPTQWMRWFNREHATGYNPVGLRDRRQLDPVFRRWIAAGVGLARVEKAIARAYENARDPISNLPAYVDRILTSMQTPPRATSRAQARRGTLDALTGRGGQGDVIDASATRVD